MGVKVKADASGEHSHGGPDGNGARGAVSDVRVSVIVPTCGRPTLRNTLASITSQFESGDEIIVCYDTSGDSGDSARNRMVTQARGTHLVFVDDDDELRPGALSIIRRFAADHPGRIGIFRANRLGGPTWSKPGDLNESGNALYVVPNVPGKLGHWESPPGARPGRCGDYTFITETVALQGEPVWREEIIQEIRPEKSPWKRLRYRVALRTRLSGALRRGLPSRLFPA